MGLGDNGMVLAVGEYLYQCDDSCLCMCVDYMSVVEKDLSYSARSGDRPTRPKR